MLGLLRRRKFSVDSREGKFYLGFGKDLLGGETGRIYWEKPVNQGIVFGASGSGKSELVARKTYEDILQNYQSFNIDPKGSKSWLEAFLKACWRLGILYDEERGPIILALPYPDISFKFNPLQDLSPHQIAFVIASGVPESKEPFWWQISYEITLVVAIGLKARGLAQITFGDIYEYISVERISDLKERVFRDVKGWGEYKEEAMRVLDKLSHYEPQYFSTINASLRTYLTRLITGEAGKILNVRTTKNLLKERLETGDLRFFAFLNAEAMKQTAYDVARLIFAWLLTYVGEKSGKLEVIRPQLRVNIDELTEVGFHEINKMVRLVRKRNVSVFMLTQSPSGLRSAFRERGSEVVEDIINSCDLRVFFRMNSPEDGQYVSAMSPEVEKPRAIIHKNSISITYQRVPVVEKFDTQSLSEGYGYAFLDGTVYYFYTPLTKDPAAVKVVWSDQPERYSADVIVNMKRLARNYLEVGEEEDVIVVVMSRLKENWKVGRHYDFDDMTILEFWEETKEFFKVYREECLRVLDFIQGVKYVSSVVRGKIGVARINLLDHLVRTAMKAYNTVREQELPQEEKEKVVLACLVHDIGKILARESDYQKEDHIRYTLEVLRNLEIPEDIANLAAHHHGDADSLLAKYVKAADHDARREEEELTAEEKKKKDEFEILREEIRGCVNRNDDVIFHSDAFYVSKSCIISLFGKEMNEQELERKLGGRFVRVRVFQGRGIAGEGVYMRLDAGSIFTADELNRIKIEKSRSPRYRRVRVEVI